MLPGTVNLPDRLHLPAGLVGLHELTSLDVRCVGDGPLLELVWPEDPVMAFSALPAEAVRPAYVDDLARRSATRPNEQVLVLLAVHGEPPTVTANFAGPLVVARDGTARQLLLDDQPLRWPVAAS